MSSHFDFDGFLSQFGIDSNSTTTNPDLTYENLVLQEYGLQEYGKFTFPMRVVQILETPRGPTEYQEWAVGSILPYLESSRIRGLSFNMNTINPVTETPETLIIYPYGYVNSILLACLDDLSKWKMDWAVEKAQYIQAILPYLSNSGTWSLSPQNSSSEKPFARFGIITTPKQTKNPYNHINNIF